MDDGQIVIHSSATNSQAFLGGYDSHFVRQNPRWIIPVRSGPEVFVKIHWTMNFQNSLDQIMLHGAGIFRYIYLHFGDV